MSHFLFIYNFSHHRFQCIYPSRKSHFPSPSLQSRFSQPSREDKERCKLDSGGGQSAVFLNVKCAAIRGNLGPPEATTRCMNTLCCQAGITFASDSFLCVAWRRRRRQRNKKSLRGRKRRHFVFGPACELNLIWWAKGRCSFSYSEEEIVAFILVLGWAFVHKFERKPGMA